MNIFTSAWVVVFSVHRCICVSRSRSDASRDLLACLTRSRSAFVMFSLNSKANSTSPLSLRPSSAARFCPVSRLLANSTRLAKVSAVVDHPVPKTSVCTHRVEMLLEPRGRRKDYGCCESAANFRRDNYSQWRLSVLGSCADPRRNRAGNRAGPLRGREFVPRVLSSLVGWYLQTNSCVGSPLPFDAGAPCPYGVHSSPAMPQRDGNCLLIQMQAGFLQISQYLGGDAIRPGRLARSTIPSVPIRGRPSARAHFRPCASSSTAVRPGPSRASAITSASPAPRPHSAPPLACC